MQDKAYLGRLGPGSNGSPNTQGRELEEFTAKFLVIAMVYLGSLRYRIRLCLHPCADHPFYNWSEPPRLRQPKSEILNLANLQSLRCGGRVISAGATSKAVKEVLYTTPDTQHLGSSPHGRQLDNFHIVGSVSRRVGLVLVSCLPVLRNGSYAG